MKLVQPFVALLPLWLSVTVNASTEVYRKYRDVAQTTNPVVLDENSYEELTAGPRNYSAAVLLTARDTRYGCQMCRQFHPEWDLIAKSWLKGDKAGESKLVFGTLDFDHGKTVFQKLQLQTAPVLLVFGPTEGPGAKADPAPVRFDFSTGVFQAEPIHAWIVRNLPEGGPKPPFTRPVNYVKIITVSTIILGAVTLFSVAAPYLLPIIQNRNVWAAISLISILLFTSGHMFNHIRKVPYVGGDGSGGMSYFAGGFSNQFGMETQIIAAIYGILSFATISIALKVPRISDPKKQQVAVWIWAAVMLGMYSFLLSVFRVKNGGYPFWLPPF